MAALWVTWVKLAAGNGVWLVVVDKRVLVVIPVGVRKVGEGEVLVEMLNDPEGSDTVVLCEMEDESGAERRESVVSSDEVGIFEVSEVTVADEFHPALLVLIPMEDED